MTPDSFVVDLQNPEDVREKLRVAESMLREQEAELERVRVIERRVNEWRANVELLSTRARQLSDPAHVTAVGASLSIGAGSAGTASVADMAVEVVNREVRKIRSRDVCDILRAQGLDVTPTAVSNALHYAANRAGRIQTAPGRGMYAPLEYKETVIFDSTDESASSDREAV